MKFIIVTHIRPVGGDHRGYAVNLEKIKNLVFALANPDLQSSEIQSAYVGTFSTAGAINHLELLAELHCQWPVVCEISNDLHCSPSNATITLFFCGGLEDHYNLTNSTEYIKFVQSRNQNAKNLKKKRCKIILNEDSTHKNANIYWKKYDEIAEWIRNHGGTSTANAFDRGQQLSATFGLPDDEAWMAFQMVFGEFLEIPA